MRWGFPLILLVSGITGTFMLSEAFRQDAHSAWTAQADRAGQWLSGTVLNWLEESYAPLSGLAALAENSSDLTEDEFLNAYDNLEARATAFFLDGAAYLRPTPDGEWQVLFSTNPYGLLPPESLAYKQPWVDQTVNVALTRFGEMILGPPHVTEDGVYSAVALTINDTHGDAIIMGLVDYAALIRGLFDVHVPQGMTLDLRGKFLDGGTQVIWAPDQLESRHAVTDRTVSAGADLSITWNVNAEFAGGPSEELAQLTLISGSAGTVAIILFIAMLLVRNEAIAAKVREATAELKESQDRFELAVRGSGDALWEFDARTEENWFSPRFVELLGYEADELPHSLETWQNHIHPDDADQAVSAFLAHLEEEIPYDIEYRMRTKAGEWRWFRARARSLRDANGKAFRTSGTVSDITERVNAERQVKESEERMEAAARSAELGLWDWYPDSGQIFINDAWATMLGYDPRDFRSGDDKWSPLSRGFDQWLELLHPDDKDENLRLVQDHLDGNSEVYRHELRLKRKDGGWGWVLDVGKASRNAAGEVTRMSGIHLDIHKLKQLQTELEGARDKAEEATRAKSDFLANMSHEIRTPMNAVIGLSHLALGTDLDRKQRDYLNKISASANNLLGIINDILDFSKIEAGKLDMERIDFDLAETLDNFSNVVAVKAEEKGIELIIDMDSDTPMGLKGDPLRLNQILINLANNAVKFTDEGEIAVSIRVLERAEDTVFLRFEIRDTGIGMNEEQQSRLFQAFSQADSSTTRKFGGTGLGLTISKRLVEMMDGEIGVDSIKGEGSTFHFTAHFGIGPEPLSRQRTTLPEHLADLRVLIVDDNPTSRTILARYLESFGLTTGEAASGEEGLRELEQAAMPYRLVLMDWRMPGMDGIETARRINTNASIAELPHILMVSAYGRQELMAEADDAGIAAYLVKPVNPSTLLNAIMEAFGHGLESHAASTTVSTAENLRGAHLLLVEDNEINQQVAEELLTQAGISVEIADNGQIGVSAIQANPLGFDGVLMDIQMPVMDGYTAAKEIRKHERLQDIPIIAMTANAFESDREQALEAGMNAHVAKPIDVNELFETLARFIDIPEERRQSVTPAPKMSYGTDLPDLPGLDTDAGLARVGGNTSLYRKILTKFLESQADAVDRIQRAIREPDLALAQREAHTLKGLAGNIGAEELQHCAEAVETSFKNTQPADPEMMKRLSTALTAVLDTLTPLKTPDESVADPHQGFDDQQIQALLGQLRELLEDDDSDAVELVESLESALEGNRQAATLTHRIEGFINDYDFDAALDQLSALEGVLKGTNDHEPGAER